MGTKLQVKFPFCAIPKWVLASFYRYECKRSKIGQISISKKNSVSLLWALMCLFLNFLGVYAWAFFNAGENKFLLLLSLQLYLLRGISSNIITIPPPRKSISFNRYSMYFPLLNLKQKNIGRFIEHFHFIDFIFHGNIQFLLGLYYIHNMLACLGA